MLGDDALLNRIAGDIFREYNTRNMINAKLPAGASGSGAHKLIVANANELDSTHYLDTVRSLVVTFDHERQECVDARPAQLHELERGGVDSTALAVALQMAVEPYITESYPNGQAMVFVTCCGNDSGGGESTVHLCISSSKFNANNFWNGHWRSAWAVNVTMVTVNIKGAIGVDAHYFEEGNVQMKSTHDCKARTLEVADVSNMSVVATAVVEAVKAEEIKFLEGLTKFYEYNNNTTFKELRRTLPVTRTKFQWDQASHNLALALKGDEMVDAANAKMAAMAVAREG